MGWKGASQPKTLERTFQAVETAQAEMRRREHDVLRTRGRLVWLQLCEAEDGARPHYSGHTYMAIVLLIPTCSREPWKALEEGCHRPLKCMSTRSDCS